jgi:hypothetical protein
MIVDSNNDNIKVANFSSYLIGEFYEYTHLEDGTIEMVWYDSVDCIDFYSEIFGGFENIPSSLQDELIPLHNTRWMCPDIRDFVLQNDPINYNFGKSFNWVVNFCDVVAARKGITDPNCVPSDSQQMWDYINYARISTKYVRQFFNPDFFMKN